MPVDVGEVFFHFIKEFRDKDMLRKYDQRLREMVDRGGHSFKVDFMDLMEHDAATASLLMDKPNEIIDSFSLITKSYIENFNSDFIKVYDKINIRFYNFIDTNTVSLRNIDVKNIGHLVSIDGIITRMTDIKKFCIEPVWECQNPNCGELIVLSPEIKDVITDQLLKPSKCTNANCNSTKFRHLKQESRYLNWQKIRIQERPEDLPPGQLPRYVEAILLDDMPDSVRPGDRIVAIGVPMITEIPTKARSRSPIFENILFINNIESTIDDLRYDIDISEGERIEIESLAKEPDIYNQLTRQVSPAIKTHPLIKEALVLYLFGGVSKTYKGNWIRGDSHVLLLGDPGVGKSQLIQSTLALSSRGVYINAKQATDVGITASAFRDKDTGDMGLEAGALVVADKGHCGIDEFDKMDEDDRNAIHEPLEQQTCTISKAQILVKLNSRTAVIAAANPIRGRYNEFKTLTENTKIPPTILTRFDLIFVMKDRPDPDHDREIAEHILQVHSQAKTAEIFNPSDAINFDSRQQSSNNEETRNFLLYRKYIHYYRTTCKPRFEINSTAGKKAIEFYIKTRNVLGTDGDSETITITARYLEGIIRLSEARAKCEGRTEVTESDVDKAIEILTFSLSQVGIDPETGQLDIDGLELGRPRSQQKKTELLLTIIKTESLENKGSDGKSEPISLDKIIELASQQGIDEEQTCKFLKTLIEEGLVYEPKTDKYLPL